MLIGLDTETELVRPGLLAPPLVCMSLHASGASTGELLHWRDAEQYARGDLESSDTIVGCNIAFDMAVLMSQFPALAPAIFAAYDADHITDIQCREKLLDIARGSLGWVFDEREEDDEKAKASRENYSLTSLVFRHFGEHLEKENTWRFRYGELRHLPISQWPEEARTYPLEDARYPVVIHAKQAECSEYLLDEFRQARAAFWLYLAGCWGLPVDAPTVDMFERAARDDYERLGALLVEHGLKRPDRALKAGARKGTIVAGARDTKAAARRMLEVWPSAKRTAPTAKHPEGQVCLDEDACIKSGDPVLAAWGDFGSTSKTLKTDVGLLRTGKSKGTPADRAAFTGRIHARYESLVQNGRTATRPNIQNWPTAVGMRECVVPPEGFAILAGDFAQNELRTLAQVCIYTFGKSRLAEIMNANRDAHLEVAAVILGCSYDEAEARFNAKDPAAYKARQTGKVANYGFPGGMGFGRLISSAALQYKVILTEAKARELKDIWFTTLPEMVGYFEHFTKLCAGDFPTFEQIYSHRFRGGMGFCDACNTPFSGLAADLTKSAGWETTKACWLPSDSPLFGCRVVNFPHDELVLEVPEYLGHECALELERTMLAGARPWLPDVPPVVDTTLMRRWSKQAKRVLVNGRLVAWDESMIPRSEKEGPMTRNFIDALQGVGA